MTVQIGSQRQAFLHQGKSEWKSPKTGTFSGMERRELTLVTSYGNTSVYITSFILATEVQAMGCISSFTEHLLYTSLPRTQIYLLNIQYIFTEDLLSSQALGAGTGETAVNETDKT